MIFLATKLGFNLLLDRTGKLLFHKQQISKKDIAINARATRLYVSNWIVLHVVTGEVCLVEGLFVCCCSFAKAVAAVVKASPRCRRYSAHAISHGILHWYATSRQMPRGISVNCSAVRDWALRTGTALRKLAAVLTSKPLEYPLSYIYRLRSRGR